MAKRPRTFDVGTPVRVARGPFKGTSGVVLEFCDDLEFLIVDFGKIRVKILASILVKTSVEVPKPRAAAPVRLRTSHQGRKK